jgi:hypothetical protein
MGRHECLSISSDPTHSGSAEQGDANFIDRVTDSCVPDTPRCKFTAMALNGRGCHWPYCPWNLNAAKAWKFRLAKILRFRNTCVHISVLQLWYYGWQLWLWIHQFLYFSRVHSRKSGKHPVECLQVSHTCILMFRCLPRWKINYTQINTKCLIGIQPSAGFHPFNSLSKLPI